MSRILAVVLTLVAVLAPAWSASADTEIPDDVAAAYGGALPWIQEMAKSDPALAGATGVTDITEIQSFTFPYLHGESGPAIQVDGEWLASIVDADGAAIGVLGVDHPPGAVAQISGGSSDVDVDLAAVGDGILIQEPMRAEAFVLRGDMLEPFNDRARAELPQPMTVDEFQKVISARVARDEQDASDTPGSAYNWWFLGGALALSTAVGIMVIAQRRRQEKRDAR